MQCVAPVILVDMPLPARIEAAQLAQALPADFEQMGFGLGKNRRRARHAAERRQFNAYLASRERDGAMFVENARHVLQNDVVLGAGFAARLLANITVTRDIARLGVS